MTNDRISIVDDDEIAQNSSWISLCSASQAFKMLAEAAIELVELASSCSYLIIQYWYAVLKKHCGKRQSTKEVTTQNLPEQNN